MVITIVFCFLPRTPFVSFILSQRYIYTHEKDALRSSGVRGPGYWWVQVVGENGDETERHLRDGVREEEAHRLAIVCATASLGQRGRDVNSLNLIAQLLLLGMGNSVGNHQTFQSAAVQVLNGLAGQDAVNNDGVDFLCAVLHDGVGSLDKGTAGIGHVVDDDGNLVLDATDEDHARDLVGARTLLVNEGELQVKTIGDGSGTNRDSVRSSTIYGCTRKMYLPLGTTGVGADNDAVAHVEVLTNPLQHARLSIQVVHWDIEKALDLAGVQIHGDNMVAASSLEHVGHELGSDGRTALIFLILTSVREVGDDSGDAPGRSGLAGVDHDKKLHEAVVDIIRPSGLQDEDCKMQGRPSAPASLPPCLRVCAFHRRIRERESED